MGNYPFYGQVEQIIKTQKSYQLSNNFLITDNFSAIFLFVAFADNVAKSEKYVGACPLFSQ